ncbi:uncharacterized protein K489DRAFT_413433 [Dissoconium aciculare CBS 342.82]|jgi:hypothetical protein|uniref:RNA polymerase II subunit B1 CTD phosphatase RPAP2 homolog n=1 Tax=Dissoconium aciculare CBS 342.82 TaxID=1314786 RepID=A0A6J3LT97_9PEZI|nr:uncharacterized protein K489DRAFT_413433 [Dissoconium aciculare CBS 342.82]KAF1819001.1 hypothetical protein K489DRAFT_413433 [Dissoconium aciculare CBS 342.82]
MNTRIPASSILKQPSIAKASVPSNEQETQAQKDKRNLDIALRHAHKIQNQKDAEAKILDHITTLIDIPSSAEFTPQEALKFLTLVVLFQPSDFDSLIEERHVDGKCGYALCSKAPRRESLMLKLTPGASNWCSEACARKGLYVKAQLSSVPAWERSANYKPEVQLHQDDQKVLEEFLRSPEATAVRRANRAVRVDAWRKEVESQSQLEKLAAERGENVHSFRPGQILADGIIEKTVSSTRARPPGFDGELDAAFDAIEGYQPRRKDIKSDEGDSGDDE